MSELSVNSPQSSRRIDVTPSEISRYGAELSGYALAGDRSEARLELTHRTHLDVKSYIAEGRYNWYSVQELDRLDIIAFEYLGDSRLWWIIADFNYDLIPDTLKLVTATKIRLPTVALLQELLT